MNTEWSLIQLALRNPRITVDLKRKGLKAKHFKDKNFGKVFNIIHTNFTQLGSTPTTEELSPFQVKRDDRDIPFTVEHLVNNILKEYNTKVVGNLLKNTAEKLTDEENGGVESAKSEFFKGIKELVSLEENKKYAEAPDIADEIWENYKERSAWAASGLVGIPLGFHILDEHIRGLGNGWMVTISARNGVGKTWILANAALQAWKQERNIAVFSCEMTSQEFLQRMICIDGNINPTRFRDGICTFEETQRFKDTLNRAEEKYGRLYLSDNPMYYDSIDEIIQELNEKNPDAPIEAVYIDAVYRLSMEGEKEDVRQKRIAVATKTLAQKYKIPVVVTTQMNREFGKMNAGKNKVQGGNFTIAGSDAFNTESDVIILLNKNEEVYSSFHYIDMILEKFRHGEDGINYMIEMNLNIPALKQVDYKFAKQRIGDNDVPVASRVGNIIFEKAKEEYNSRQGLQNNSITTEEA